MWRTPKAMPEQNEEMATVAAPENAPAQPGEEPGAEAPSVGREEFEQLRAERDQLLDRLARMQAEFENARKRGERERNEFREFAAAGVVEQFLPVLDNFQLALK